jgi:hypothetical protein
MAFCNAADVVGRLSHYGVAWQTSDASSSAEFDSTMERAIEYADTKVGFGVQTFFDPVSVLHGNAYLKHLAVSIAAWWIATKNGEDAAPSIQLDLDRAMKELDEVRRGSARIPGASYPGEEDTQAVRRMGLPRVWNPR